MKKAAFIIILKILFLQPGYAQKNVMTRMLIPQSLSISPVQLSTLPSFDHSLIKANDLQGSANTPLVFFNDLRFIKLKKAVKKPVLIFTELSFSDLLENSMNSLKPGLINKYDDGIPELFKDAPSLLKVKCIIQL